MILHPSSISKVHEWKPLWLVFWTCFGPRSFQKHLRGFALINGSLCDLCFDSIMLIQLSKTFGRVAFMIGGPLWFLFWLCFGSRNLQKHLGGLHKWMIPSICGKHFDSITNLREFYNLFEMASMSYFDDLFDILFWFYS